MTGGTAKDWPRAEDFLAEQYPRVRRFLRGVVGCPPDCADEITNDACKLVYDRWERLLADPDYEEPPRSYLFKVAARRWYKRAPDEQRWRRSLTVAEDNSLSDEATDTAELVIDQVTTSTVVWEVLAQMDRPERQVLWLRHAEDFSTRDTARILHLAEGTVKHRLHGAVKDFKALALVSQSLQGMGWDGMQ